MRVNSFKEKSYEVSISSVTAALLVPVVITMLLKRHQSLPHEGHNPASP
ncbi:MAG: hypothetical protein IJM34_04545 [Lachnospiraceae bacterium]|nr:hypothetical protein [Lachnospiraceae bacterium]